MKWHAHVHNHYQHVNEVVGELHDWIPVILEPQGWATWEGGYEVDPATLLKPAGEDVLKV